MAAARVNGWLLSRCHAARWIRSRVTWQRRSISASLNWIA